MPLKQIMMESPNLDQQHQLHQQLLGSSSSSSVATTPSFHFFGSNLWSQNLLLTDDNFDRNDNGVLPSSRDQLTQSHGYLLPTSTTSMIPDLGPYWTANAENYTVHSTQQANLQRIKDELSGSSFPVYGSVSTDPHSLEEYHSPSMSYIGTEKQHSDHLNEKIYLKTSSSGDQIDGVHESLEGGLFFNNPMSLGGMNGSGTRGSFSTVLPTTNISSNFNFSSLSSSNLNSLGMSLDLLAPKFCGGLSHTPHDTMALFREVLPFGLDNLQKYGLGHSSTLHEKLSSSQNGVTETKRPSSISNMKLSQATPKKPRFESASRTSCPPIKVRKEKLGDRIAALQQLVAPFGKTDTASVLMEAIGYIKFLHEQVETLSVPYMRSTADAKSSASALPHGGLNCKREEPELDLRSRGLCLVPLSCMTYITRDGGNVWFPSDLSRGI
ncbi:Transcription factor [Acorus gramineus]|uniref:Transcription factor n=1 Tax=Acorus gramineus TaxID=55184 RepID=A0AAV9BW73_ACOGR|nr:Transcription factor [Acorus gramineus]